MKMTAAKYVNARKGNASTDSPNPYYLEPGDQVEIKNVTIGSAIEGNSIWYLAVDDCYYWSGGFLEKGLGLNLLNSLIPLGEKNERFQYQFLSSMLPDFISAYKLYGLSVSVGKKENQLAIIVSATEDFETNKLPAELVYKGFTVSVLMQTQEEYYANNGIFQDTSLPMVLGGSLENAQNQSLGSRGLLLECMGNQVILTCYHVACYNLMVNQKTSFDFSNIPINLPAKRSYSTVQTEEGKVFAGSLGGYFDYSLVTVNRDKFTANIANIGFPKDYYSLFDMETLYIGQNIRTSGCISGYREGTITRLPVASASVMVNYSALGPLPIYGTIETTKICVEGDSGACVVDQDNKVIGIVIASNGTNSLVMPFYKLISIHPLKLVTT